MNGEIGSGRPEAGGFAPYAKADLDRVGGDDALAALRRQATRGVGPSQRDRRSREEWLRRGTVNESAASFHIAGHALHHLEILRQEYLTRIA